MAKRLIQGQYQVNWSYEIRDWAVEAEPLAKKSWEALADFDYTFHGIHFEDYATYWDWCVTRWKARNDLYFLCKELLGMTEFGSLHRDVCDWVYVTRNEPERIVLIFRGAFKTSMISIGYSIQRALLDPGLVIFLFTGSLDLGRGVIEEVKKKITDDKIVYYFPELLDTNLRNFPKSSEDIFSLPRPDESRRGHTLNLLSEKRLRTGFHADFAVFNDAVTETNFQKPSWRMNTHRAIGTLAPKIRDIHPKWKLPSNRMWEGTLYHNQDEYMEHVLPRLTTPLQFKRIKNNVTCIPIFTDKVCFVPVAQVRPELEDSDPRKYHSFAFPDEGIGWDRKRLLQKSKHMLQDEVSTQFFLRIVSSGSKIFHDVYDLPVWNDLPRPLNRVVTVDWASEEDLTNGDEIIILAWAVDGFGRYYILDWHAGNQKLGDTCELAVQMAESVGSRDIVYEDSLQQIRLTIEDKFGDAMKKCDWDCHLYRVNRTGTKTHKVDFIKAQLQDIVNDRRLYVRNADTKLINQLDDFPKGAHDDLIDALAIGLASEAHRKPYIGQAAKERHVEKDPRALLLKQREEERRYNPQYEWDGQYTAVPLRGIRRNHEE